MSYSASIVLDDVSGDDITYTLVAPNKKRPQGSRRIDVATMPPTAAYLEISHESQGVGASGLDRRLVSITDARTGSDGLAKNLVINLTVAVPQDVAITTQIVKDRLFNLKNWITEANIEALLRGEI